MFGSFRKDIFRTSVVTAVITLALAAVLATGAFAETQVIRVGIVTKAKELTLGCAGRYFVRELASGRKTEIGPLQKCAVTGDDDRISVDGKEYRAPVVLDPADEANGLTINGRRYRDVIRINCRDGKLTVVNELDLDDYLCGVLPREAERDWPLECLKAQAVASRTYVLQNLGNHEKDGFDVCSQTHCQVYGGLQAEDPRTSEAVEATLGEIVLYNGQPAQTFFHASSGGYTEDPANLWRRGGHSSPPYLRSHPDKYAKNDPYSSWTGTLNASVIREKLEKAGYAVGEIKKIIVSAKSSSGRARTIKVLHSAGTLIIPAAQFRLAVDAWRIKSTLLTGITKAGGSFRFRGRGWGHGVGMSQTGAKVMAEKGFNYADIINFYYPGTVIEIVGSIAVKGGSAGGTATR